MKSYSSYGELISSIWLRMFDSVYWPFLVIWVIVSVFISIKWLDSVPRGSVTYSCKQSAFSSKECHYSQAYGWPVITSYATSRTKSTLIFSDTNKNTNYYLYHPNVLVTFLVPVVLVRLFIGTILSNDIKKYKRK